MIRIEASPRPCVRVIGSRDGRSARVVFEAISRGSVVLDLSEVDEAKESAVFIAGPPARGTKRVMKKTFVVLAGLVVLPVVVAAGAVEWARREAKVDTGAGYVVLLHGSGNADPRSWVPAARVGRPRGHVFPVEWLVDVDAVENMELVEAVTVDLDFYLKDVGRPDPWSYARYHCQTTSNWYGDVHWACP